MNLYLIRHADALPLGTGGVLADEDRPLSNEGVKQAKALGQAFLRSAITLDKVLTSPLLRAKQTAEHFAGQLQLPADAVQECEYLAPGGSSKKLAKYVRQLGLARVALVGHEPDISLHAAWLIGSKKTQLAFAKAAAAYIACEDKLAKGAGTLNWLLTPDWLERSESIRE